MKDKLLYTEWRGWCRTKQSVEFSKWNYTLHEIAWIVLYIYTFNLSTWIVCVRAWCDLCEFSLRSVIYDFDNDILLFFSTTYSVIITNGILRNIKVDSTLLTYYRNIHTFSRVVSFSFLQNLFNSIDYLHHIAMFVSSSTESNKVACKPNSFDQRHFSSKMDIHEET